MSSADLHTQSAATETNPKQEWSLTKEAFDKLLLTFAADRDEAAAQYEVMRRKLVRFFEWRAVESADEHADETINRVARRIDEGQTIENLKSYFYGVARMVFMEALKNRDRLPVCLDDAPQSFTQAVTEMAEPNVRLICLDNCLDSLTADNRNLIVAYYQEERRAKIELRQELADTLHIPLNALRIRTHRIRISLEKCITTCLQSATVAK